MFLFIVLIAFTATIFIVSIINYYGLLPVLSSLVAMVIVTSACSLGLKVLVDRCRPRVWIVVNRG